MDILDNNPYMDTLKLMEKAQHEFIIHKTIEAFDDHNF